MNLRQRSWCWEPASVVITAAYQLRETLLADSEWLQSRVALIGANQADIKMHMQEVLGRLGIAPASGLAE